MNRNFYIFAEIPKFENFKAVAIDENSVRLSWKKVPLLSDLENYDADSIQMRMMITKSYTNITSNLVCYFTYSI